MEGTPVAGLIGLTAGAAWVALLAVSCARLVRRASWIGRVGEIALALVVAQFVVLPVAAGTAGTHPPRLPVESNAPFWAQEVAFPVGAGVVLHGWYTAGSSGAAVVLLPGSGGTRAQTMGHAAVLASHGFGVLAVDARGSGDSTGYGNLWGWTGNEDISAAVDWLARQAGVDPSRLGVVGLSMGGEEALTAAAADSRIRAVVAEGVESRVPADTWYLATDLHASVEQAFNSMMWTVADLWSPTEAPRPLREVVGAIQDRSVLLIAADTDEERVVAQDLVERSSAIELWQTVGMGHVQALASAPAEWESRVVGFLMRTLRS